MSKGMKQKQLHLLDLPTQYKVTERARLHWNLFYKEEYDLNK
jgi:hypothetical protein